MSKKVIIDNIIEVLIEERRVVTGTIVDSYNEMEFTDERITLVPNSIMRSLANQANAKHHLEWGSYEDKTMSTQEKLRDIPASEAYASTYEAILVVAEEYEEEELEEIYNNLIYEDEQVDNSLVAIFMAKTKALAETYIKNYLISSTKKDRTGKIIGNTEYTDSCLTSLDEDGNEVSFLDSKESTAKGTRSAMVELFGDNSQSALNTWFIENHKRILTKKQVQYINDELDLIPQQAYSFRKGIEKRVLKALEEEFNINGANHDRLLKLNSDRKILEEVLDAKDFEKAISSRLSKEREYEGLATVIDEALAEYCTCTETKAYRMAVVKTKEVIKPLRIALYKKLNEVNIAIEEWENFVPEKVEATTKVLKSGVSVKNMKKAYLESLKSPVVSYKDEKISRMAINKAISAKNSNYPKEVWFSEIARVHDAKLEDKTAKRLLEKNQYTPEIIEAMENKEINSGIIWKRL